MANAKSFFPEDHPNFIGTYWGQAWRIALERHSRRAYPLFPTV